MSQPKDPLVAYAWRQLHAAIESYQETLNGIIGRREKKKRRYYRQCASAVSPGWRGRGKATLPAGLRNRV
jgi:hypothetical protein